MSKLLFVLLEYVVPAILELVTSTQSLPNPSGALYHLANNFTVTPVSLALAATFLLVPLFA